jgi:hypothetical protein
VKTHEADTKKTPSPVLPRDTSTCSLGIGRVSGSINWDVTVYNVPQSLRQDVNIVATAKNQIMGKGQSLTVNGITITNVDNAPGMSAVNIDIPFESVKSVCSHIFPDAIPPNFMNN